jgi:hypothetical protein
MTLTHKLQSRVLSRHASGMRYRWGVEARNINAWCMIPGSPFAPGFLLRPNAPDLPPVAVEFGPFRLPTGIDTFTFLVGSDQPAEHRNALNAEIAIIDPSRRTLARSISRLEWGDGSCSTLTIDGATNKAVRLHFGVTFDELVDPSRYGTIDIRYVLGYQRNPLADLFNAAGSDKGTEIHAGGGVPHCYALEYFPTFTAFREDAFNLLEIGLQNISKNGGRPTDAPSLRGWRQFFPNATVFGYDINDFSFLAEEATFTFQGDQASRQDLERFLESFHTPRFRVVIDDGSHVPSHQQISLAALFRYVEPHGMYVIEDLGWQPYPESPRTLEILKRHMNGAGIKSPFITRAEARYLEASIERIEIYRPNDSEFALIRKKGRRDEASTAR